MRTTWLVADSTPPEAALEQESIDILSNGFKLRATDAVWNTNNGSHVGIAYAKQSGKWSNVR